MQLKKFGSLSESAQRSTIKRFMTKYFHAFNTVTPQEIDELLKNYRMRNLMFVLAYLAAKADSPYKWMMTSINNQVNGSPRTDVDPKTHHKNHHAVDIAPVTVSDDGKAHLILPLPMNRNLVLMSLLDVTIRHATRNVSRDFPFIGIESDHIHADIDRAGDVCAYMEVRPALDRAAQALGLRLKHLNTRKLKRVQDMYEVT